MIRPLIGALLGIAWLFMPRRPMPTIERLKAAFAGEKMPQGEFIPKTNMRLWSRIALLTKEELEQLEALTPGPLCECGRPHCSRRLPVEAWCYVLDEDQTVVLPGHETKGARRVPMDGFTVAEYKP